MLPLGETRQRAYQGHSVLFFTTSFKSQNKKTLLKFTSKIKNKKEIRKGKKECQPQIPREFSVAVFNSKRQVVCKSIIPVFQ